ncbi:MAG: hypothetical protein JSW10_09805 [Pseudomonadota bacterium]|nr:MAG: hypothetical protein JSW10_09805 [Pseudomonadota bacterium]
MVRYSFCTFTGAMLFALFAQLVGCSTTDKLNELDYTVRAYERVIRWGDLEMTGQFRKERDVVLTDQDKKRMAGIRVTSYDVVDSSVSKDKLHAQQLVKIRYYFQDTMVEKTISDRQDWAFDEETQKWYLESYPPEFK